LEFWYVRKKAKKIIYDFDDALMYRSSGSKNPYSSSRRVRFAYMMKRVDFVIAGNQFLKSEVLAFHPNVEVIPTSIDLSRYSFREWMGREGRKRVLEGYTLQACAPRLLSIFKKVMERN